MPGVHVSVMHPSLAPRWGRIGPLTIQFAVLLLDEVLVQTPGLGRGTTGLPAAFGAAPPGFSRRRRLVFRLLLPGVAASSDALGVAIHYNPCRGWLQQNHGRTTHITRYKIKARVIEHQLLNLAWRTTRIRLEIESRYSCGKSGSEGRAAPARIAVIRARGVDSAYSDRRSH